MSQTSPPTPPADVSRPDSLANRDQTTLQTVSSTSRDTDELFRQQGDGVSLRSDMPLES